MVSRSRCTDSREVWQDSLPSRKRGHGVRRAPDAPAAFARKKTKTRAHLQGSPGWPSVPTQWFYGLFRALPGDRAFLPPSPAKVAFRELDASVGASGPHVFAVRMPALSSLAPPASTASRPASVTIASRPSEWDGMGESIMLLPPRRQEQFRKFRNKPEAHGLEHRLAPLPRAEAQRHGSQAGDLICPSGNQSSPAMTSATLNDEAAE